MISRELAHLSTILVELSSVFSLLGTNFKHAIVAGSREAERMSSLLCRLSDVYNIPVTTRKYRMSKYNKQLGVARLLARDRLTECTNHM